MNTLTIINMLRDKGIATVRTPSGIQFFGAARANSQDKAMMSRLTQTEFRRRNEVAEVSYE